MRLQERKGIPGARNEEEPKKQKQAYKHLQWEPLGELPTRKRRAGFTMHTATGDEP